MMRAAQLIWAWHCNNFGAAEHALALDMCLCSQSGAMLVLCHSCLQLNPGLLASAQGLSLQRQEWSSFWEV